MLTKTIVHVLQERAVQVTTPTLHCPNRCWRLGVLVRAHSAVHCAAVYSLSQPAAQRVYNTHKCAADGYGPLAPLLAL